MLGYLVCYKDVMERVGYMDVTEGSRAMLGHTGCYTKVMEGSRPMQACPLRYMDVTQVSWAMLGYSVCYAGSKALLGCPVNTTCMKPLKDVIHYCMPPIRYLIFPVFGKEFFDVSKVSFHI
jgi:hypothetical protein